MRKILIVGNVYDKHISRLVTHVKRINPSLTIDILNTSLEQKKLPEMVKLYNKVYFKKKFFPQILYKIPLLGLILTRVIDPLFSMRQFKREHYDIVNIHFLTIESYFLMSYYKKIAEYVIASPWGSDIYRVSGLTKRIIKSVLNGVDFITAPPIKFKDDIINKFKVDSNKFVNTGFGSDVIDAIVEKRYMTRDDAKALLGYNDMYVITIGYNASPLQHHEDILRAIFKIRKQLPDNLLILLPMTYGGNKEYIDNIKQVLSRENVSFQVLEEYLSANKMILYRKCSDMFIHGQPTDAFSGSVQEYILTENKVLNGIWTLYPDLEKFGKSYYVFDSFEELDKTILQAYNDPAYVIGKDLESFIVGQGWLSKSLRWEKLYNGNFKGDELNK